MFLDVSLPANAVQSPDMQKNRNSSFSTQGPWCSGLQEKKIRSLRRIKACQTDLVWIYSLSSYLCSSYLFSKSASLLSHYTACFYMRRSFNLEFCILFAMSLFCFLPHFTAWLQSVSPQHGAAPSGSLLLPQGPLWVLPNAAQLSHSMTEAPIQEETAPKRLPASLPLSPLPQPPWP